VLKRICFSIARILFGILIFLAPFMAGCKKYVQHPGSVNAFDSQAYDALLAGEGAIKQGKTDYAAGSLPDAVLIYFNDLIRAYDVADATYKTYHDAATKGQDTATLASKLTSDIANLTAALTAYQSHAPAKGKSP
jgi:hypothetical protein